MGCRRAWSGFRRQVGGLVSGCLVGGVTLLCVALGPLAAEAAVAPRADPAGAARTSVLPLAGSAPLSAVSPGWGADGDGAVHGDRLSAAVGADGDGDGLTLPPMMDPKSVETRPVGPGGERFTGHEEVLASVPVLTLSGSGKWDDAYDILVAAIKALDAEVSRLGLKRAGDVFVVYGESGDDDFKYEVQMPFSGVTTKKPSGGMTLGASYAGKVMRFTHSGAFTDMDNTYEMIANYLDEKNINAGDLYMEQYRTDLATSAPDKLKIDILVPVP